ncbi:hypothetical protein SteCoe_7365 [Stentor coeruleus]|uniref:MORN repeat protein n=1 Tax=Stentor coeruleus TaxID=5963 RepID=A0A1R2CMU5_9CILI|nr:hypothetical protein SteCoe_7365 [Stentor coeruleus]
MSYSHKTGEYYGSICNDIPHGQGTKKFYDNSVFSGTWVMGMINKGNLRTDSFEIEVEYENGYPKKLLKVLKPSSITELSKTFTFPIAYKKEQNYWEEIPQTNQKLTYTAYFSQGYLKFDGILFKTPLINIIEWENEFINYFGEYNIYSLPEGYCEIIFPYFKYIGSNKNLKPHGQGKKYYGNGMTEEGFYIHCELNGIAKICHGNLKSEIEFYQNNPLNGQAEKDNITISFNLQNMEINFYGNINESKQNEIKNMIYDIYSFIAEAKINERIIYDECSLSSFTEYVRNKGNYKPIRCCKCQIRCFCCEERKRLLENEIIAIKGKNWYEYEMNKLNNINKVGYEKICLNNSIFKGEIPIGKGKISSAKGFFKGKVCNTDIGNFGEMVFNDVGVYHGEFKNGKRDGVGMMCYKSGERYKGYWKNDRFHGQGYYFNKGNSVYGQWENGFLISSSNISIEKK